MKVFNVSEIFDNGEFATLVTRSGQAIHLPEDGKHSICVTKVHFDKEDRFVNIDCQVDFYQGD